MVRTGEGHIPQLVPFSQLLPGGGGGVDPFFDIFSYCASFSNEGSVVASACSTSYNSGNPSLPSSRRDGRSAGPELGPGENNPPARRGEAAGPSPRPRPRAASPPRRTPIAAHAAAAHGARFLGAEREAAAGGAPRSCPSAEQRGPEPGSARRHYQSECVSLTCGEHTACNPKVKPELRFHP